MIKPHPPRTCADASHKAYHAVNDKANHRKAPVRRETEQERDYRLGHQEMWGLWYHIMGKQGKIKKYGKPSHVKDPVR